MDDSVKYQNIVPGYSSPENVGHKRLEGFWDGGPIFISEKVDGGQCSAMLSTDGTLCMRSHKTQLNIDAPDKMFQPAVDTFRSLMEQGLLKAGYIYRGEAMPKPKSNTICYGRAPKGGFMLFDVDKGGEDYMLPDEMAAEAERLGLECVPLLATITERPTLEWLDGLINRESILGGSLIEGCVGKNYRVWTHQEHHVMMFKYVRPSFREINKIDFKLRNPSGKDIVGNIIATYATSARWQKAVQHLREDGKLQEAPQDIPLLMAEISRDILCECGDEIRDKLFNHFWKKDISRGVTAGLAEWWKQQLKEAAFPSNSAENAQDVV